MTSAYLLLLFLCLWRVTKCLKQDSLHCHLYTMPVTCRMTTKNASMMCMLRLGENITRWRSVAARLAIRDSVDKAPGPSVSNRLMSGEPLGC
jgi:hypothetical protein